MSTSLERFFKDLEERGLIANAANLENFYQLKSNEKVVYLGIDCTGERLHIGHLFLYFQTTRFAKEGFKILLILGGATSKIGDPSDKDKERPLLEENQIENYQEKIKSQLEKILIKPKKINQVNFTPLEQFYSANPKLLNDIYQILKINREDKKEKQWESYLSYIWSLKENTNFQILNNKDWLEKMNFIDFLRQTGKYLAVAYLSSKEPAKKRIKTGLSFLEFSYPLIQAYDFYYLYKNYNCCGQLGGSDQWGNLTTGLKLISSFYPEEEISREKKNKSFAFNFPLLTDKNGEKFSKSGKSENVLWLNSDKKDFFEFFRNMTDDQAQIYIKQFTFLEESQINQLLKLNNPPQLRILQRILYELIYFFSFGEIGNQFKK